MLKYAEAPKRRGLHNIHAIYTCRKRLNTYTGHCAASAACVTIQRVCLSSAAACGGVAPPCRQRATGCAAGSATTFVCSYRAPHTAAAGATAALAQPGKSGRRNRQVGGSGTAQALPDCNTVRTRGRRLSQDLGSRPVISEGGDSSICSTEI